jgi:hypothetical protein
MAERSTLNGVRTVFPCGDKYGKLADRYADYSAIPLLKRLGAQQCGAAGYWYVDADLAARLRDEYDRATDATVKVVDEIRQGAENLVGSAGKWALVVGALYLVGQFLSGRRRT